MPLLKSFGLAKGYALAATLLAGVAPVAPSIQIAGAPIVEEGGLGIFTVSRTTGIGSASVNWAVTGEGSNPATPSDFSGSAFPSGTVTFAEGETSKIVQIQTADDSAIEGIETYAVSLSGPTNGYVLGNAKGVGTITDNDTAPDPGAQTVIYTTSFDGMTGRLADQPGWRFEGSNFPSAIENLTVADGAVTKTVGNETGEGTVVLYDIDEDVYEVEWTATSAPSRHQYHFSSQVVGSVVQGVRLQIEGGGTYASFFRQYFDDGAQTGGIEVQAGDKLVVGVDHLSGTFGIYNRRSGNKAGPFPMRVGNTGNDPALTKRNFGPMPGRTGNVAIGTVSLVDLEIRSGLSQIWNPPVFPNVAVTIGMNGNGLAYYYTDRLYENLALPGGWRGVKYSPASSVEIGRTSHPSMFDADDNPINMGGFDAIERLCMKPTPGTNALRLRWSGAGNTVAIIGGGVSGASSVGIANGENFRDFSHTAVHGDEFFPVISITAINSSSPPKNFDIREVSKASSADAAIRNRRFNPAYVERMKAFNGPWRFMDLMNTNGTVQITWAQRATLTSFNVLGPGGIPPEDIVALCVLAGRDPWVTPAGFGDNDYHAQFAAYLNANLPSVRRIYYEIDNEPWNSGGQFLTKHRLWALRWIANHGRSQPDSSSPEFDFVDVARGFAERHIEIMNIIEPIFATSSNPDRLVRVFETTPAAGSGMGFLNLAEATPGITLRPRYDIICGSTYFQQDPNPANDNDPNWSDDIPTLMQRTRDSIVGFKSQLVGQRDAARLKGKYYASYEGGQSHWVAGQANWTGGWKATSRTTYLAYHRSPEWKAIMKDFFLWWDANMDGPLCGFIIQTRITQYGGWGYRTDENSSRDPANDNYDPKWAGLAEALEEITGVPIAA